MVSRLTLMAGPMAALRRLSSSSVAAALGRLSNSHDGTHLPLAGLLLRWPLLSVGNAVGHTGAPQQGWSHWGAHHAQEPSSVAHDRPDTWQGPPSALSDTLPAWRADVCRDAGTSMWSTLGSSESGRKWQAVPAPSPLPMLETGRHCCTTVEQDGAVEHFCSVGTAAEVQIRTARHHDPHFQSKTSRLPLSTRAAWPVASPLVHVRHLSVDVRAKPRVAQARTLRLAAQSVNTVVEPYKKPTRLPLWRCGLRVGTALSCASESRRGDWLWMLCVVHCARL